MTWKTGTKEETLGLTRVKVKAVKDEKEGYVTMAGNQGTLEPRDQV